MVPMEAGGKREAREAKWTMARPITHRASRHLLEPGCPPQGVQSFHITFSHC